MSNNNYLKYNENNNSMYMISPYYVPGISQSNIIYQTTRKNKIQNKNSKINIDYLGGYNIKKLSNELNNDSNPEYLNQLPKYITDCGYWQSRPVKWNADYKPPSDYISSYSWLYTPANSDYSKSIA